MASTTPVLEPAIAPPKLERPWKVILFNDEKHSFEEVINQLQKAIGCSEEVGEHIAMIVHNEGSAVCYTGKKVDCERVASILKQIKLTVEVEQDS